MELDKELIDKTIAEFFENMRYIQGASTVMSRKGFARCILHALNHNITDRKITLKDEREKILATKLSKTLEYRTILLGYLITQIEKQNKENENSLNEKENENVEQSK